MARLRENGIQARPVWQLNHLQIPYQKFQNYKIENAQTLLVNSVCLPSGVNLSKKAINEIICRLKNAKIIEEDKDKSVVNRYK